MSFSQFVAANWFLFAALILVLFTIVVYEIRHKGRVSALSNIMLSRMLNQGATLLDMRTQAEFKKGHIAGAQHKNTDALTQWMNACQDKNTMVILCDKNGTGVRTHLAELQKAGFNNVFFLKEGIDGWMNDNLPLVR